VQKAYHYRRATQIYKGPFLVDVYADWVTEFREGYQARYLQALTFLAEFHLERERFPQAIEFARRILAADEYYEAAYYSLIRAYARSGQRPQGKRVYTQCREMLAEFGLSPQKTWEELCR
jgi:DNA-binding SARP family transcriptional activator